MANRFERAEIVAKLKEEVDNGRAVFDAFAGTGISAKFAEAGGADMITTHILARFRMAGLSSMILDKRSNVHVACIALAVLLQVILTEVE